MHNELSLFQDKVHQGQKQAATKAIKRTRFEKLHQYKRKGNKEQASFNMRVDKALAKVQLKLPEVGTTPALKCTHKALERGRRLIAERQKLIRIADCLELGWSVVSDYTADELADDSDDKRRLEKAERSAEKKVAKRKKKCADPPAGKQNPR